MKSTNFYPLLLLLFPIIFPHYSRASNSPSQSCNILIAQPISAYGGSDGIAKAISEEGIPPFTYQWSNGATTQNAVNLRSSTYSVTITDDTGATCSNEVTLMEPSKIENYIFEDQNGSGVQDDPDLPLPGVLVKLTDSNGNILATTISDDFGIYTFDGLMPGDYHIEVEPPSGYRFSYKNLGSDYSLDNDFSHRTSSLITLSYGEYFTALDAGLYDPGSLGDFIFNDLNKNGIQDIGESGIPNIAVTISGTDGGGHDFQQSTFSDANGHYSFQNLRPGRYTLHFSTPQNMEISPASHGPDHQLDSDIDPESGKSPHITVASGRHIDNIDAGFYTDTANIGNFVFSDNNANGVFDSGDDKLGDVTVILYAENTPNPVAQAQTDINGQYTFQNLNMAYNYIVEFVVPHNYIVTTKTAESNADNNNMSTINEADARTDLVFLTQQNNDVNIYAGLIPLSLIAGTTYDDVNNNNRYEPNTGDMPIDSINVILFQNKASGSILLHKFSTQSDGEFIFTQLDPRYSYNLEFFDPQSALNSPPITNIQIDPNGNSINNHAAMRETPGQYASISGYTFFDTNEDGIYNGDDEPLSDVVVSLYFTADPENTIQETTADQWGYYAFEALETNEDYLMKFISPIDFAPSTQSDDTGYPNNKDSTLVASVFIGQDEANYSFNAGFSAINPDIGEFVWFDINENGIQDDGPEGVPGIVVDLIDYNKEEVIVSATTNASGFYRIRNTPPGTYYLRYSNIPQNYTFAPKDEFIDGLDSDVNTNGKTDPFTLERGQADNFGFDVGLVPGMLVPVELVSFTAQIVREDKVQLDWITAKEDQNQKFVVEKSSDGINFHALAVKDGKGNSNELVAYNHTDKVPFFGQNYYRLKQVDFGGDFVYSEIKSATIKAKAKKDILIYPNPTPDFISVQSANPLNKDVTVKLINDRGIELRSFSMATGENLSQIDLSSYPPGAYYIHVIYEDESNSMFKIFKVDY